MTEEIEQEKETATDTTLVELFYILYQIAKACGIWEEISKEVENAE